MVSQHDTSWERCRSTGHSDKVPVCNQNLPEAERCSIWNAVLPWPWEHSCSAHQEPDNNSGGRVATVSLCALVGRPLSRTSRPTECLLTSTDSISQLAPVPKPHIRTRHSSPRLEAGGLLARDGDYVYRYDPQTGQLSVVADSFVKPNGLVFSPDESVLYVTDSGANQEADSYYINKLHHIIAFDMLEGRHLINQRLFAVITPGFPDGLKVDSRGNVYASSFSGVQVFNPLGDLIGEINLPGTVNFTFDGPGHNILFIMADDAIWAAVLATARANRPQA